MIVLNVCLLAAKRTRAAQLEGQVAGPGGRFVAFSTDGTKFLSGDARAVRIWNARSFQPLTPALEHGTAIGYAGFTSRDQRVVTAGGDDVRIWDSKTGKVITRISQNGEVGPVSASPDGKWVLTASGEGGATLWDAATAKDVRRFEERSPLCWSAFSRDGKQFLTVNYDRRSRTRNGCIIHLRNTASGRDLITPIATTYGGGGASPAEISPDGGRLVVGQAKSFEVYDVRNFRKIAQKATIDEFPVDAGYTEMVHFTPDGRRIIWVIDAGVQEFDAETGKPISPALSILVAPPRNLAFDSTGAALIIGGLERDAGLWSVASGKRSETFGDKFSACVSLSPDGKHVAIGRTYPPSGERGYTEIWTLEKPLLLPLPNR